MSGEMKAKHLNNQVINPWTPDETKQLQNAKGMTKEEIISLLPLRSWSAIRGKAKKLKIRKLVHRIPWNNGLTQLTDSRLASMAVKESNTRIQHYAEGKTVIWNKGKHIEWNRKSHDKLLLEHLELMKEQGFKVIPLLGILPDGIAIKNGKVYAVELETNSPNYKKYTKPHSYDDVIWIVISRRRNKKNG